MFSRTIFPSLLVIAFYAIIAAVGYFYFNSDNFAFFSIEHLLDQENFFMGEDPLDDTYSFIEYGLVPAIIAINALTSLSLVAWFFFGEFIGIEKPGEANKFIFVWLGIYLFQVVFFILLYWYFLHFTADVDDYLKWSASISIASACIILNAILFFIFSVFLSSRVIRPALPTSLFMTIIYRIKGASS